MHSTWIMCLLQVSLCLCLLSEINKDYKQNEDDPNMKTTYSFLTGFDGFDMYVTKFIVTLAMHLSVGNLFSDYFNAIKFITNHPDQFTYGNNGLFLLHF